MGKKEIKWAQEVVDELLRETNASRLIVIVWLVGVGKY